MSTQVFDVECYRNFFLVLFKDIETKKVTRFQASPSTPLDTVGLRRMLSSNRIVGFNSKTYDIPMCLLALQRPDPYELLEASNKLILGQMWFKDFCELYDLNPDHGFDHIDLIDVAPLKGSLKIYAGRLHCKKMQDLPVDPQAEIDAELAKLLVTYCGNDLDNTILLWEELAEQIKLREELSTIYSKDLRSKSDAQIGEAVIGSEIKKIIGVYPRKPDGIKRTVQYDIPSNINFTSPRLKLLLDEIREAKFIVQQNGKLTMPDCLNTVIRIGGGAYRMGNGGLHSSETSIYHLADDDTLLIDRDVASFYPNIILNQRLYPKHLGPAFLEVYRSIVDRRLAAKREKRKVEAESLKIVINGSFGKLGSMFSLLYSPQLLIQVTVSGQLYLLMLIEMIEHSGIPVISANTDGIVIKCPRRRYDDLNATIKTWEQITAFETEETQYKAVYSRDVNNYIAIKTNGEVKSKGVYNNPWTKGGANIFKLHKNPTTTICIDAVVNLLDKGVSIPETLKDCKDIRKFVAVRSVSGGAQDEDGYLGKAIRWYYAKGRHGSIAYAKRKAKVNKSDHARPLMELPEALPDDIDYSWYVAECHSILQDVGWLQRSLFQ